MKPQAAATSEPWSARRLMLLGALLLVTLVNIAHMVELQQYFGVVEGQDVSSSSDEQVETMAVPKAVTKTVAKTEHQPTPVPQNATQQQLVETPGCEKLDKTHADPNFFREDACYTRDEVLSIIRQLVFTAADTFTQHNVTYFLDSGTLLGAFRSKGIITHDNDADFGIDSAGLQYLRETKIDFPPQYFFTVWASELYPTSDRDDKLPARLIHRESGLYVDVFAFLEWNDAETGELKVGPLPSWCFMNCAGCPTVPTGGRALKVPVDWIYPLVDCEFEGRKTIKCPHKTKQYLRYTFGQSYMRPIKYTHG